MNIKDYLDNLINKHGIKLWNRTAQKDVDFVEAVEQAVLGMPEMTFNEKVLASLMGSPICHLGNRKKYKSITMDWGFCAPTGKCPCAAESVSMKCKNIDHVARLAKTSATLKERYGSSNPGQAPSAKAAHRDFYVDPVRTQQAVEKGRATMLSKYGVDNAFKLDKIDREAIARRNWSDEAKTTMGDPEKLAAFLATRSIVVAAQELNINPTTMNNYISYHDIRIDFGSSYENEIAAFLTAHDIKFISRSRSIIAPRELDFFIPEYNLGIEFNGLYYHSCQIITDDTHHIKMNMCSDVGVRLLMINEDEWLERVDIIKRKILILCNRGERGIGARKLIISRIEHSKAHKFCETHHLQGAPSRITDAFGAKDVNGELVSIITFGQQRGTDSTELNRFCTDGKLYPGAFTRILKLAREEIDGPIISFADLRYSDGAIYRSSGFQEVGIIRPDYRYVKRLRTYHKANFTKKKIGEKFNIDMTNLTEREAMKSLGYSRIYDCGKMKFLLS